MISYFNVCSKANTSQPYLPHETFFKVDKNFKKVIKKSDTFRVSVTVREVSGVSPVIFSKLNFC